MSIYCIIVDPQNSFCKEGHPMCCPGGMDAMTRLANMIYRTGNLIKHFFVSLEQHPVIHISSPYYWKDKKGNHPNAKSQITLEQIQNNEWMPIHENWQDHVLKYALAVNKIDIWEPHCIDGTEGYCIAHDLQLALENWQYKSGINITRMYKGNNKHIEQYSMISAKYMDVSDKNTCVKYEFVQTVFNKASVILIGGLTSSHCLGDTLRDILLFNPKVLSKVILLTDATVPVPGYEHVEEQLIKDLTKYGMQTCTTKQFAIGKVNS